MDKIKCVNCGYEVDINISNAVDENGEEFMCPHCGFIFRYAKK